MEIRSVTLFCEPDFDLTKAQQFLKEAGEAYPFPVQSRRVALPPFPDWWDASQATDLSAASLTQDWREVGTDYLSVGPVGLRHEVDWLNRLPALLGVQDMLFASAEVADHTGSVSTSRCIAAARVIEKASRLQADGFGNLYFGALANCPPGIPFLPAAYHGGGPAGFALAVQSADLALKAVQQAATLEEARANLVAAIEAAAGQLTAVSTQLAREHRITFRGIDFSLAPFPTAEDSLAGTLESLGLSWLGTSGSLFAAGFITDAIDRARFPRCGFSGLMLPVMEDLVLATRAAEGRITIGDLLSWAAVCGVGLDTVPLPGEVSVSQLAAILLDVAGLATRLNKPLIARLMPMPGLAAGDPVNIDFPYFANSRVLDVPGRGLGGLLEIPSSVTIIPYHTARRGH